MKKNSIHLLIVCISAAILGFGCVLFIKAMLGADAMTTFSQGLDNALPLSLSACYALLNIIMVIISIIIDYHQVGIGTFIFPVVSANAIDYTVDMVPDFTGLWRIIAFIVGILLISFAIALASKSQYGKSPNDAMNFAIMKKVNKEYNVVRGITDGLMLLIGILLGGQWGIGTVIAVLCTGTIAMFFMQKIDKFNFVTSLK